MLWEVEILPSQDSRDHEGQRILADARSLGINSLADVRSARSFLIEGDLSEADAGKAAEVLLCDRVVERFRVTALPDRSSADSGCLNVLLHPGVTDSVAENAAKALAQQNLNVTAVATCRKYWLTGELSEAEHSRVSSKVIANDAIEHVISGPLQLTDLHVGTDYRFTLGSVAIRDMNGDEELMKLSADGQLYLQLAEMQTIRDYFKSLDRDPTDIELETIAQTWSEHCSHKTLAGRIHYVETQDGKTVREIQFNNMLKETVFAATMKIRENLGDKDWCVSVFKDNAGIVTFDENQDVCIKVETHNHPSAIEPYGGANTGLGGVIRDPMGTGLGARPVCNTDVFCFARPDFPADELPPGVLHPKAVMEGVVSGVRDYGNRMGIPTVNGAVYFDDRYLGNPLVYCGNIAMIPRDKSEGKVSPGDLIVAVGGRTGRDGIHGATFSSAELTEESESISGGAVQIGNPVTEKMVLDVLLVARDRNLYTAITDCGAGGFSSAVGEMGEKTGAEVWLEKAPLKYSGLSYTEIWISEAQERMVLAVPESNLAEFDKLCRSEGVEASVIGRFTDTRELVLKYEDHEVGRVTMDFLHDGRPPVIREATFEIQSRHHSPSDGAPQSRHHSPSDEARRSDAGQSNAVDSASSVDLRAGGTRRVSATLANALNKSDYTEDLKKILGSLNVASKEWIIRQYDHEVQAGSVVKPLVGINSDGPSDAAVVRPDLTSNRGLVISCGMNPHYGDLDPYWMAASAIDEAIRNCVAVGADPSKIAILDNFCWGNTERPETLGTLVRAALACQDIAIAYGTPFVSGKDSLNNEFSYEDKEGNRQTVAIPSTLLITALGQIDHVEQAVTMDLKASGNKLYLVGTTRNELGGSHFNLVNGLTGGDVPQLNATENLATYNALHAAIKGGFVRSCHDLSEGGLAVAAAEMAFAGGVGVKIEGVTAVELFSESNGRFLVEVEPESAAKFETTMASVAVKRIGETNETCQLTAFDETGASVLDDSLTELKRAWQSPLSW